MQLRPVIVAVLASRAAAAAPEVHVVPDPGDAPDTPAAPIAPVAGEAHVMLTGTVAFLYAPRIAGPGLIRLTVKGVGEIGDACEDAGSQQFIATFVGELVVAGDDSFVSRLQPVEPAIRTPSGCVVDRLHIEQVTDITIDARIGELWGSGVVLDPPGAGRLRAQIIFTLPPEPIRT